MAENDDELEYSPDCRYHWYYTINGVTYGPTTGVYKRGEVRKWIRKTRDLARLPANMPLWPLMDGVHPNQRDIDEHTKTRKHRGKWSS